MARKATGRRSVLFPSLPRKVEQNEMINSILINSLNRVRQILNISQECLLRTDDDGQTYLHLSAYFNKTEITDLFIKSGLKVDSRDNDFLTPLHIACLNNASDCVRLLIERGADLNSRNREWLTPLHACAYANAPESLLYLIENETCLNITDIHQATALHYSVAKGHLETTLKLIEAGADPKLKDSEGRNCLHYASSTNNLVIIDLLLKQRLDINAKDNNGQTCLHFASMTHHSETVNFLIKKGANINDQDCEGNTPLHYACSRTNNALDSGVLVGREQVCKILINSGATLDARNNLLLQPLHLAFKDGPIFRAYHDSKLSVDCKDYLGRTPLHIACYRGNEHLSETLIKNGANLRARDKFNRTPLHYAVEYSFYSIVTQLINLDADLISLVDDNNCNALHYAAKVGQENIFYKLADIYPNFNDKDNFGRTVHFYCAHMKSLLKSCLPIVDHLDSYNRNIIFYTLSKIHSSSPLNESLDYILSIQNLKLDINQRDIYGRTPLHYACFLKLNDKIDCLIRHYASLYIEDDKSLTPIHYLIQTDNHKALTNLIENKLIDLNSNRYKQCLLQFASFHGSNRCLIILLKNNYRYHSSLAKCLELATLNGRLYCLETILSEMIATSTINDLYKSSALHIAAMNSNFECFNRLMVYLERCDMRDEHGRTPIMFAMVNCKEKNYCVDSLLSRADCDLNALDNEHRNVLFYSVYYENLQMVQLFLQLGVNALQKSLSGKTVLHLAAILGNVSILNCLIDNLKQNNIAYDTLIDGDGFNPLHYACYKGNSEIVKLLIDSAPEKDTILNYSSNKINYLHLAAYSSNEECMKLILNHFSHSIINKVDSKRRNALHYLCMSKIHLQLASNPSTKLEQQSSSSQIINSSSMSDNEISKKQLAAYKLLVNSQININYKDIFGKTPLMIAIQNSSDCRLNLCLIDETAIDLTVRDLNGLTALHYSAKYRNELAGQKLVRKDSSLVNLVDKSGQTALHISSSNGLFELTKSLLFTGASCFVQNSDGFTPALKCAKNNDVADCLDLIIEVMIFERSHNETNISTNLADRESIRCSSPILESRKSIISQRSRRSESNEASSRRSELIGSFDEDI